eukprot:TRINITY_DN269_c1_g2_i1.p1 TRINITY_DN269_c1_g2~~TRINITY_DN269_c1_g2_i1.p1  ORF type:complete len:478 (-),score=139.98 TRINITY_DN269_c1_g2_i1:312-1745(-)
MGRRGSRRDSEEEGSWSEEGSESEEGSGAEEGKESGSEEVDEIEEKKFKKLFKSFDTNGNGTLTRDEMAVIFRKTSGEWSDEDLDYMFSKVDTDGNGVVDYNEFVAWLMDEGDGSEDDDQAERMEAVKSELLEGRIPEPGAPAAVPGKSGNTWKQRFLGESAENSVKKPFKGATRMLSVALNYEGTDAPLGCVVDCDRLTALARKCGVRDIVKMYDTGSTKLHPCIEEVQEAFKGMCGRSKGGDFIVIQYSGHGSSEENAEEESGYDSVLCLRTRDGGEQDWLDDDFSQFVFSVLPEGVNLLLICDACHSAGALDLKKMKKRAVEAGGNAVAVMSGCQDTQCSIDTGDGGRMTLALLSVLKKKATQALRKSRKASIQYIFNRMVDVMPEDEAAQGDIEEFEDEEGWEGDFDEGWEEEEVEEMEYWDEEEGEEEEGEFDAEEDEEGDVDPMTGEEPEPGQTINLMWMGKDTTEMAFPF